MELICIKIMFKCMYITRRNNTTGTVLWILKSQLVTNVSLLSMVRAWSPKPEDWVFLISSPISNSPNQKSPKWRVYCTLLIKVLPYTASYAKKNYVFCNYHPHSCLLFFSFCPLFVQEHYSKQSSYMVPSLL